jgi:hypothetical protein
MGIAHIAEAVPEDEQTGDAIHEAPGVPLRIQAG